MKRNWDLVKEVLEQVEKETLTSYIARGKHVPHYTQQEVLGHVEILIDAGVLNNAIIKRNQAGSIGYYAVSGAYLTMAGHDLLDCLRDESTWERICDKAKKAGVAITWEFLKQAIPVVLKELL